jgi:hypothetical protein
MTNDDYTMFRAWLNTQTLAQAYQGLDQALGSKDYLRVLWDQQTPGEWGWLTNTLIQAWQTEFQYRSLVPRQELRRVQDRLALTSPDNPQGLLQLSPEAGQITYGALTLPSEQGQLTVIDSLRDYELGPGLWLIYTLVPTYVDDRPNPDLQPRLRVEHGE